MATTRTTGTPLATLAILLAIVCALVSEPEILAHSPDGSQQDASGAVASPSSGGRASVADALGLTASLLAVLDASSAEAPAGNDSATASFPGYPPSGMTVPVDMASAPPRSSTKSSGSTTATSPKPGTPQPAAKPATHAAVWNIAPIVTWYGPGFYGGRTACGQRYTRQIIGVASRTLHCGTLVKFRWRGITVVAPVIDRGPFASSDYVFDFSARLACDLFRERGQRNGCYTRHNMHWQVVGRRRN